MTRVLLNRTTIQDALTDAALVDQEITLSGWVRTRRDSKGGFSFIQIHDGSCFDGIQVIADGNLPNYAEEIQKLTAGCSITVQGKLVESSGKGQTVEMQASELTVLGWVDDPDTYPVAKKRHTYEYLRTVAHLRTRTNTFGAMTRIRHRLASAIHQVFDEAGFFWVNTPIITASDCEGAGELFRVSTLDMANLPREGGKQDPNKPVDFSQDFFGTESYLTVSGQLQAETHALALSKVYTFGPTFRAENSNTSRHLAEFWMVEPEIAFADLDVLANFTEQFLKSVLERVLNGCEADLGFFNQFVDKTCLARLEKLVNSPFERVDYTDAIAILEKCDRDFEFPVKWGLDLQSEHERFLSEEHFGRPVIVQNYPSTIKPFYMKLSDDGKTCAAMDVLAPGIGEIIGGSQREDRLDVLDERMNNEAMREHLWWYRDLRRYGTVPHAGFGLGFERLLTYITGMENVRDAIPFPRVPGHCEF